MPWRPILAAVLAGSANTLAVPLSAETGARVASIRTDLVLPSGGVIALMPSTGASVGALVGLPIPGRLPWPAVQEVQGRLAPFAEQQVLGVSIQIEVGGSYRTGIHDNGPGGDGRIVDVPPVAGPGHGGERTER